MSRAATTTSGEEENKCPLCREGNVTKEGYRSAKEKKQQFKGTERFDERTVKREGPDFVFVCVIGEKLLHFDVQQDNYCLMVCLCV